MGTIACALICAALSNVELDTIRAGFDPTQPVVPVQRDFHDLTGGDAPPPGMTFRMFSGLQREQQQQTIDGMQRYIRRTIDPRTDVILTARMILGFQRQRYGQ